MRVQSHCGPILIVDDDDVFRALLSEMLHRIGYSTVESARGDEALEAARQDPPSLVLLDVGVPGLSGYEVCRVLREMYGQELPIIFISGTRIETLDRIGGLLLGGDDYVVKPFGRTGRRACFSAAVRPADPRAGRHPGAARRSLRSRTGTGWR